MLKTKKRALVTGILIAAVCFTLGFATAQSVQEINWVGPLVHGAKTQTDMPILPKSEYAPEVNGQVVIGLRGDGVVVWKHVADSTK